MPDVPPSDVPEKGAATRAARGEPAATSEDFLYHLYRGSDLLIQNRVGEAKDELERALAYQPQDAKSQDLLAGVYFRLGVYPRAIEIWERLVAAYPRDVTLRVNLALALFKTGQGDEALTHLNAALRIQPDHERAWGYLGLINWRHGRFEAAREAFLRGGQATMARRMEDVLARAKEPSGGDAGASPLERDEREVRSAAEEALAQLERGKPLSIAVDEGSRAERAAGPWSAVEPGEEALPEPSSRPGVSPLPPPATPPPSLGEALGRWAVVTPEGDSLRVGPRGQLFARSAAGFYGRAEGVTVVRGRLQTSVVRRRARGRELEAILGGSERPILRWAGPIETISAPPGDRTFEALALRGDTLYLVESCLFAFEEALDFESASLPLAGAQVAVTQLHGTGTAVLSVAAPPQVLTVDDQSEVHVDPARLLGWTGRLFPTAGSGAENTPALALRGEGAVIVA